MPRSASLSSSRQGRTQKTVDANSPQILIGASSSSRMGWLIKISRAFVHRNLISYSCSCTCLPGRFPRTAQASGGETNCQYRRKHREWVVPAARARAPNVNLVPPCSLQSRAAIRSILQQACGSRRPAGKRTPTSRVGRGLGSSCSPPDRDLGLPLLRAFAVKPPSR